MKYFKTHKTNGVVLIEVLMASAIVGFVGVAVLALQQSLLRATAQASAQLVQTRILNNFVVETRKQMLEGQEPALTKKVEDMDTELHLQKKDATSFSMFKDLKGLSRIIYSASWVGIAGKREQKLYYFKYVPLQDEKEPA